MTFKTLKDDSQKIFCRSNTLPSDPITVPAVVKSRQEIFVDDDIVSTDPSTISDNENYEAQYSIHVIETYFLVGRSFLVNMSEYSPHFHAKIVKALDSHQHDLNSNPVVKEFFVIPRRYCLRDHKLQ